MTNANPAPDDGGTTDEPNDRGLRYGRERTAVEAVRDALRDVIDHGAPSDGADTDERLRECLAALRYDAPSDALGVAPAARRIDRALGTVDGERYELLADALAALPDQENPVPYPWSAAPTLDSPTQEERDVAALYYPATAVPDSGPIPDPYPSVETDVTVEVPERTVESVAYQLAHGDDTPTRGDAEGHLLDRVRMNVRYRTPDDRDAAVLAAEWARFAQSFARESADGGDDGGEEGAV